MARSVAYASPACAGRASSWAGAPSAQQQREVKPVDGAVPVDVRTRTARLSPRRKQRCEVCRVDTPVAVEVGWTQGACINRQAMHAPAGDPDGIAKSGRNRALAGVIRAPSNDGSIGLLPEAVAGM